MKVSVVLARFAKQQISVPHAFYFISGPVKQTKKLFYFSELFCFMCQLTNGLSLHLSRYVVSHQARHSNFSIAYLKHLTLWSKVDLNKIMSNAILSINYKKWVNFSPWELMRPKIGPPSRCQISYLQYTWPDLLIGRSVISFYLFTFA